MSFFKRLGNIVKGKANATLDAIENPIEMLDLKIKEMEENLNKAKLSSAQVIANYHSIHKKMEDAQRESKDYDEKVKLALSNNNEELAKKALSRKLDADKNYESLKKSYDESKFKVDDLKKKLSDLEEEIVKTRQYREEAAARLDTANASQRINEILSNVNAGHNSIDIDEIERKIQGKEFLAKGIEELRDDSYNLDSEFEKLKNKTDLDSELEKYKNQL